MKLRDFDLLSDQNIHPDVVAHLRSIGFDVQSINELGFSTDADSVILQYAVAQLRVVITHDADFGTLAIKNGEQYLGIIYLRPGHIKPSETIHSVEQLLQLDPELTTPFILVAKRSGSIVNIRIRQ